MRGAFEQGAVASDLLGWKIAEDLESGRAMALKSGESPSDLADPPFHAIPAPAVETDLDRWTTLDLRDRRFHEPETPGGKQQDEHGDAHVTGVGPNDGRLNRRAASPPCSRLHRFKCAPPRSDTPEVDAFTRQIDHGCAAAGRRWLSLLLLLCAMTAAIGNVTSAGEPPPHPARWESLEGPRVPVAGAAAASPERGPALIGGFTERLEATAAIQLRDPRLGWMPVGSSLLEPRAEATAILLADDSVLVIGGWSGRLPDEVRPLGTVERIDPWNPAGRHTVPPPFPEDVEQGLAGHAACRLPDGRVLLIHGRRGAVFDPASESWSPPFAIAAERRHAAIVPCRSPTSDVIEVVLIGGVRRRGEPSIETIEITADGAVASKAWSVDAPDDSIPSDLTRMATLETESAIVVAGGERVGRSESRTWRLDPRARSVTAGPDLPIEGGVAAGCLIAVGQRLVVLGGESMRDGRPTPTTHGAVLNRRLDRAWPLPPSPALAVRMTVVPTDDGGPELVGGYRFDASAPRGSRIRVLSSDVRLHLPTMLIAD